MKDPTTKAQAVIIWMHGLGADASDMMGLVEQLTIRELTLRHVFLDAPMRPVTLNGGMVMRAWYDILGTDFQAREDKEGILQSATLIRRVLDEQLNDGFISNQIFLAGFSQGGAMALYTGLNFDGPLAGIIALSSYLPGILHLETRLQKTTPFFMGLGKFDPLVLPKWTDSSIDWLKKQGFDDIALHQYPMEHSICFEEIKDLSLWLNRQVRGVLQ
jgi:phospholipase/carboxylesterase